MPHTYCVFMHTLDITVLVDSRVRAPQLTRLNLGRTSSCRKSTEPGGDGTCDGAWSAAHLSIEQRLRTVARPRARSLTPRRMRRPEVCTARPPEFGRCSTTLYTLVFHVRLNAQNWRRLGALTPDARCSPPCFPPPCPSVHPGMPCMLRVL